MKTLLIWFTCALLALPHCRASHGDDCTADTARADGLAYILSLPQGGQCIRDFTVMNDTTADPRDRLRAQSGFCANCAECAYFWWLEHCEASGFHEVIQFLCARNDANDSCIAVVMTPQANATRQCLAQSASPGSNCPAGCEEAWEEFVDIAGCCAEGLPLLGNTTLHTSCAVNLPAKCPPPFPTGVQKPAMCEVEEDDGAQTLQTAVGLVWVSLVIVKILAV